MMVWDVIAAFATAIGTLTLAAVTAWTVLREVRARKIAERLKAQEHALRVQIDPPYLEGDSRGSAEFVVKVHNFSTEAASEVELMWKVGRGTSEIQVDRLGVVVADGHMERRLLLEAYDASRPPQVTVALQFEMSLRYWRLDGEAGRLMGWQRPVGPAYPDEIVRARREEKVFLVDPSTRDVKWYTLREE